MIQNMSTMSCLEDILIVVSHHSIILIGLKRTNGSSEN